MIRLTSRSSKRANFLKQIGHHKREAKTHLALLVLLKAECQVPFAPFCMYRQMKLSKNLYEGRTESHEQHFFFVT